MEKNVSVRDGLHVYIGTTGTGKTHKAIRDAIALAGSKRQGVLVIDCRGAENLQEIQEYRLNLELYNAVCRDGKIARIIPKDEEEFDKLIQAIDRVGNAVVFIDEVSFYAANPRLQNLCRVWRHRKVSVFMTTQKVGRDVQQSIMACDPTIYVFRVTNPTSLEWFEKWHKVSPDNLRSLKMPEGGLGGEYLTLTF